MCTFYICTYKQDQSIHEYLHMVEWSPIRSFRCLYFFKKITLNAFIIAKKLKPNSVISFNQASDNFIRNLASPIAIIDTISYLSSIE